jgi:hypothetical protein
MREIAAAQAAFMAGHDRPPSVFRISRADLDRLTRDVVESGIYVAADQMENPTRFNGIPMVVDDSEPVPRWCDHPLGYVPLSYAADDPNARHIAGFDLDRDCMVAVSEVDATQPRSHVGGVGMVGRVVIVGPVLPRCGVLCVSPVLAKLLAGGSE